MRTIGYNSQRDNFNFEGKFSAFSQCFSTAVWMFMSYYCPDIIASDDNGLATYFDDVEASVGTVPGIAEEIEKRDHSIYGKTSLFWEVQKAGLQLWLNNKGVQGHAVAEYNASFTRLKELLDDGPVIIGTSRMGGLPDGHIILGVDKDQNNIIVNDPFGNAVLKYSDINGDNISYPDDFLSKYFTNKILYWQA